MRVLRMQRKAAFFILRCIRNTRMPTSGLVSVAYTPHAACAE
jgi:hypothetical protein